MKLNITLHLVIKLIYLGKVKYRIEKSSFLEIYEDLNDIKENKEFDHVYVENNKVKNDVLILILILIGMIYTTGILYSPKGDA